MVGTTILVSPGCRHYQIGNRTLYRPDVRTVHVEIFESESFRKFSGQRMTEAVIKQIELNTPYEIADASVADSVVRGRIVRDNKRPIAETRNDDLRQIGVAYRVEVSWTDRAGTPLMPRQFLRLNRDVDFVPEAGQSMATATQELIDKIARQVAQQMEMPW